MARLTIFLHKGQATYSMEIRPGNTVPDIALGLLRLEPSGEADIISLQTDSRRELRMTQPTRDKCIEMITGLVSPLAQRGEIAWEQADMYSDALWAVVSYLSVKERRYLAELPEPHLL